MNEHICIYGENEERKFLTQKRKLKKALEIGKVFDFWVGRIDTVRMAKVASVIYKFYIVSSILTFKWKKGHGQQSYSEHKL